MVQLPPQADWENLFAGYVLNNLSDTETAQVQELLRVHPELKAEIEQFQMAFDHLPLSLPSSPPPPRLRHKILEIASIKPDQTHVRRFTGPGLLLGIGGLATLLGVGWAWDGYHLRQQLAGMQAELTQIQAQLQQSAPNRSRTLMLAGMGGASDATGVLAVAPEDKTAVISIDHLAPLPPGQVYRLWAAVDGKKVNCAEFVPDSSGRVFVKLPLEPALMSLTSVAITIELASAPSVPQGEVVMLGEI
ncbi:anti-sigma factor [Thermosynechococcaceae cyanobacterium BACA0444]|uniref:Regulator of SigK n=1 Tax=Pseudocalidococcus azoricus BACA0444 TaxID=2918990 RepID=A0AAE4JY87_9CYAN|nr:anti-sigma factor [Pseudocalidococcus azoricus]MDS3861928.1 anti-sigma factor [Pseudocalidococcus azoricus BACA0444]